MTDDPRQEIQRWVKGLSPHDLDQVLTGILGRFTSGEFEPPQNPPVDLPDPPEQAVALTVRIDVDDVTPKVWRRLVLHGDLTLDAVHAIIQLAVGWHDAHLHRFWLGPQKRIWRGPFLLTDNDLEEGEEGTPESEVRLDQLLRDTGDRLFYTYDFGDGWTHTIRLESVGVREPGSPPAVCTNARNAAPLEDVGGPGGHNELVAAYRADASLAQLEDYLREWVPVGWDPQDEDVDSVNLRLSVLGADAEGRVVAATRAADAAGSWPGSLDILQGQAPPATAARIAALCEEARADQDAVLDEEDLAAIARPYRLIVDLAGAEGIPLTQAGWMKPSVVHQIFTELEFDRTWIGAGTREDQTDPVADLREVCQEFGLLRKRKGRLLATKRALALRSDEDYVSLLTTGMLQDRVALVTATKGLFALCAAARGGATADLADEVARLMTECGVQTGSTPGSGFATGAALELARPVWHILTGGIIGGRTAEPTTRRRRTVALARAALWPDEP